MLPELYLHGFAQTPCLWDGLFAAQDALGRPERLRKRPALPFHGGEEADDFLSACAALSARHLKHDGPWHLIGYSLGARLALPMAQRAPERVAALTLLGVHPGLTDEAERAARREQDRAWQRLLAAGGMDAFLRAWLAQPMFAGVAHLATEAAHALHGARQNLNPAALGRSLDVLGLGAMPEAWGGLPRLTMPVHLITGAHDAKFCALAEAMRPHLPRAVHTVVGGSGHSVALEQPGAVARAMAAFERRMAFLEVPW